MDDRLMMFAGGIRTATRTLADGKEHKLFFKARDPEEIAVFLGEQSRFPDTKDGDLKRHRHRAKFIADSLTDEAGEPLLTPEAANKLLLTLRPQLVEMIVRGSEGVGDAGKD